MENIKRKRLLEMDEKEFDALVKSADIEGKKKLLKQLMKEVDEMKGN